MFILNWLGGLLMIFVVLFVISFVVVLSLCLLYTSDAADE